MMLSHTPVHQLHNISGSQPLPMKISCYRSKSCHLTKARCQGSPETRLPHKRFEQQSHTATTGDAERQSSHSFASTSQPQRCQECDSSARAGVAVREPSDASQQQPQSWQLDSNWHWSRKLRAACASMLAAAVLVSSAQATPQPPGPSWQVASASGNIEESLEVWSRRLEAKLEGALSTLVDAAQHAPRLFGVAPAHAESQSSDEAKELVHEIDFLVAQHYFDARKAGFSPQAWHASVEKAMARSIPDTAAAYRTIRELLAGLEDPFTRFVTPQQFQSLMVFDVTGVGLNLGSTDEYQRKVGFDKPVESYPADGVWVLATIKGSAAEKAGVLQGDQVIGVNGSSTAGESAYRVAAIIQAQSQPQQPPSPQGEPQSTPISVQIKRDDGQMASARMTRVAQPYVSPIVTRTVSRDGVPVGLIRVKAFNARTRADIADAVAAFQGQGVQQLELDLRDNLGGLFMEGVEVARLFLPGGSTVTVVEGQGRKAPEAVVTRSPAIFDTPLTVLINGRSASASEVLAGALKDNCRAVLVGDRSYGKGLIQSVYQLEDGSALIMTVGKYLTPSMIDIDRQGILPDFPRLPTPESALSRLAQCQAPGLAPV